MLGFKKWEFYPMWAVYAPVALYAISLAARARSLLFFSAVNPDMEAGGLFGASKYRQLAYLPDFLIPKTILIEKNTNLEKILDKLQEAKIDFPMIAKPDRSERGKGVVLIKTRHELFLNYHRHSDLNDANYDYLLQEYIEYGFEAAVFVYKLPNETQFRLPSLTFKTFLHVVGDGKTSLNDLILQNFRAKMVYQRLKGYFSEKLNDIVPKNEIMFLEPIGNHNRGTTFVNANEYITPKLAAIFNDIAQHLPDFHYGRFDLRAPSFEDFMAGKNLKIMEVNGANAEPVHIYDPTTTPLEGWKTMLAYWSVIFKIAQNNRKNGAQTMSFAQAKYYYELSQSI